MVVLPVVIGGAVRGAVSTVSGVKIRQWGGSGKSGGSCGEGRRDILTHPLCPFSRPRYRKNDGCLAKISSIF